MRGYRTWVNVAASLMPPMHRPRVASRQRTGASEEILHCHRVDDGDLDEPADVTMRPQEEPSGPFADVQRRPDRLLSPVAVTHRTRTKTAPAGADFDSASWSQGLDSNQRYTVLQVVGERTEPSATVRIRIENWTRVPHPSAPVRGHPDRLLSPLLSVRSRLVSRDSRRCREAIVDRLVDGHRACADDDQSENAKHHDANHDATADLKDELHARPPADYRPILHGSVAIRGCLRAVWASPSPRRRQDRHIVTDLDSRPLKPRLRR
jgi:hypothetical protein